MPLLIIFFVSIAFVSCNNHSDNIPSILTAEAVMEQHPDSALQILEALDRDIIDKQYDEALYALLLTQARHKNYIDETNDSLISTALSYFKHTSDQKRLMKALFYKANILFNSHNYPKAIILAMKAENMASDLNDDYWIAKTCELIADIYSEAYHFEGEAKYRKLAADYYLKANKISNHRYALLDLANAYYSSYETEKSIALIDSLRALTPIDSAFLALCIKNSINVYLDLGDFKSAHDNICILDKYTKWLTPSAGIYTNRIIVDLAFDKTDDIDQLIDSAKQLISSPSEKSRVYTAILKFLKYQGRYKEAVEISDSLLHISNDIFISTLTESAVTSQRDFYHLRTKRAEYRIATMRNNIILGSITLILLLLFALYYHRTKIYRKNEEIDNRMNEILILSEQIKNQSEENLILSDALAEKCHNLSDLQNRLEIINGKQISATTYFKERWNIINTLCNDFFEKRNSEKTRLSIINDIEKEIDKISRPENLLKIENSVNECMDGIIDRLKVQCPKLKPQDITFITLVYAGFAPRAICIFTDIKLKYYYNKRSRLIERIGKSDAPDKEIFIAALR